MTTIAAAVCEQGVVVLGADTQATYGTTLVTGSVKAWAHPVVPADGSPVGLHVLLGVAGQGAAAHRIRRGWTLSGVPHPDDEQGCDEWASACAEAIAELLALAVPPIVDDEGRSDAQVILGYGGRLWMLCQQSASPLWRGGGYYAVGSGGPVALGFLHARWRPDLPVADAVSAVAGAVDAAAHHDVYTGVDGQGPHVLALSADAQVLPQPSP